MKSYKKQLQLLIVFIVFFNITSIASAESVEAQWEVYQIRFTYNGEFTYYSCDGIERKVRRLLNLLGARNDARVETECFSGNNLRTRGAQRIHRMNLAFALPVPAEKTDFSKERFPAEWQEVSMGGSLSRKLDGGDCELLSQFQRYVVPRLLLQQLNPNLSCFSINRPVARLRGKMKALKFVNETELEPGR
jgi:hypothetical protein